MKKLFWFSLMIGSLCGWVFAIFGLVKPIEDEKLKKLWKVIFCTWVFGHPLELAVSLGIGEKAALSGTRIVLKTLAFGFTWWVPLKLGIIRK